MRERVTINAVGIPDRRSRRREESLAEILDLAVSIMAARGVAGLTMTELARSVGIKPPSLYKYYPSAEAVLDALFGRAQQANLEVVTAAIDPGIGGLPALEAALTAAGRWAVANPILAQLLFWRPIPDYTPTAAAFSPTIEVVSLLRTAILEAARVGQIHPDAATDEGLNLLAILHFGVIGQQLANDPDGDWEHGRYTTLHARAIRLFIDAYPPTVGDPADLPGAGA